MSPLKLLGSGTRERFVRLLALALATSLSAAPLKIGDPLPSLSVPSLIGTVPDTAGKVVVLDFWASWCAPCKISFPAYAKLHTEFGKRGLVIVAVGIDDKQADHDGFLKRMAPPFATLRDTNHDYVSKVVIPTMPTSYVVDRAGKVRFIHSGYHGADTDKALRREIEQLLKE